MLPILITVAFVCGFAARLIGLPPLIGFLIAGFALRGMGYEASDDLLTLGNFGVTLLLFTIGLKLKVKDLLQSEIWAGTSLHMLGTVFLMAAFLFVGKLVGLPLLNEMTPQACLLAGFALSFSSTVFAVKSLEDRAELAALHGVVAIGMLIMQDVIAVVFLAVSTGQVPTLWAFTLLLLIPMRYVLGRVLERTGHGELLILLGFLLALAIYAWFDGVGIKGDLGAILLGMLLANHPKSAELSKTLFGFKDVFLVAFFLSIGLSQDLSLNAMLIGLLLMLPLAVKVFFYAFTLLKFHMKPRSALLSSLVLANYSEFGLIVGSISVGSGWLSGEWIVVLAVAVSVSFVIASPLNAQAHQLAGRWSKKLAAFETEAHHVAEIPIDLKGVSVVIFGMGNVGSGAYDQIVEKTNMKICGFDSNPEVVERNVAAGRNVLLGSANDLSLQSRIINRESVQLVLLAMADHRANLNVAKSLGTHSPDIKIAATARYVDEEEELCELGIDAIYNYHKGAGAGFASNSMHLLDAK